MKFKNLDDLMHTYKIPEVLEIFCYTHTHNTYTYTLHRHKHIPFQEICKVKKKLWRSNECISQQFSRKDASRKGER